MMLSGEAFDKVARVVGLGYPGGPKVDKLAQEGKPCIELPKTKFQKDTLDFSFSGIKTAVINLHHKNPSVNKADLCIVCFSDTSQEEKLERYSIIKSHLITRAVENVMPVVSINSTTGFQTAPTAVINQDGETMLEADAGKEIMLTYEFQNPDVTFGMKGRMVNSDYFMDRL